MLSGTFSVAFLPSIVVKWLVQREDNCLGFYLFEYNGASRVTCAYCSKESQLTKEHIIPEALLDVFAECKFTIRGDNYFQADATVKDVCFVCNNEVLSPLDEYGSELIKRYFVKEYDPTETLEFEYEYLKLIRWLLKLAYNNERAMNRNGQLFADYIKFINGETDESPRLSVFAGLAVDTSPMPEFYHDNLKLQIVTSPKVISGSILEPADALGTTFRINKELESLNIPELKESFLFRFGSAMFLVMLWHEPTNEKISAYEWIMQKMYPYTLLNKESTTSEIKRVTHAFNIHSIVLIDTDIGMDFADRFNGGLPHEINPIEVRRSQSIEWDKHVSNTRARAQEERLRKQDQRKKKKKKKKQG
jgi:hypothetical protein